MQFERFYSLNQSVVVWFAHLDWLGFQRKYLQYLFPAEITSTCFTWKMSRCNLDRQNKKWQECFHMHEIGRINGRKVF